MAINYPGPYVLKIFYGGTLATAQQASYNLDIVVAPEPGDLFSTMLASCADGVERYLNLLVDDWVGFMAPFYATTDTIFRAELYSVEPDSYDMTFISQYTINEAGTGATARIEASQLIFTFRSLEGGVLKLVFMSTIYGPSASQAAYIGGDFEDLVAAVVGGYTAWLARDTSYPYSLIGIHPGQNEARFKKLYR